MQKLTRLLSDLAKQGVTIRLLGEQLEVELPDEDIDDTFIAALSENKAAIVSFLKDQAPSESQELELKRMESAADYPVSSSQYRVWLSVQLEENNTAYNIPGAVTLKGNLQPDLLFEAINLVIARHEILRTVFRRNESGEVRQVVLENIAFEPLFLNVTDDAGKQLVAGLLSNWGTHVFNLGSGPLLDIMLLQLEHEEYILAYNIHHIICDGWSVEILMRDVMTAYQSLQKHTAPVWPALELQFRDFAIWQQQWLQSSVMEQHRDYWQQQLSDLPAALNFPAAYPRPAHKTYNGATITFNVGEDLSAAIHSWTRKTNNLLFAPLLAAVKAVIYRYTGQQDLIVGAPLSERNNKLLHDQIGFYVNSLPLRTRFAGTDTFAALAASVANTLLGAIQHHEYPLDLLIDQLKIKRDTSRATLFDILVVLQGSVMNNSSLTTESPLEIAPVQLKQEDAKFDITITFIEVEKDIRVNINYNTDIYSAAIINRLAGHLQKLLAAAMADDQQRLDTIPLLTPAENNYLQHEFNNTTRTYPLHHTIISHFREAVINFPDRPALICNGKIFTYREMDMETGRLASFLMKEYNAANGTYIGMMLERNEWLLITMFAILKTGAAFVPFDPDLPAERLKMVKADSNCLLTVTQEILAAYQQNRLQYSADMPVIANDPAAAAYLIYTSGTTGRPKGVVTSHASIINYNYWFVRSFHINQDDSSVLLSNIVFSGVYTSVFGTLLQGGALHIIPKLFLQNAEALATYITAEKITFLKITPSHLNMLLHTGGFQPGANPALRLLVIGGDRIKVGDLRPFLEELPRKILYHYGATETTMGALTYEITRSNLDDFSRKPRLGKPIHNVGVYILDQANQLAPQGVAGEIAVSGAGLSPGYYGAASGVSGFVQASFNPALRIYKTGDCGRLLEDGTIEFLGRKDNQIKVRGYRIEVAEIEYALLQFDGISSVIVRPLPAANEETEIVAYFIAGTVLSLKDIRTHLKKRLPDYMIPSSFLQMDAFPLSITGKVDLHRLPLPAGTEMETGVEFIAPRNVREEKLAAIWQEVLDKRVIGIHDDFFELGGHSLKFAILINKYAVDLSVKLQLKDAFLHPTIEAHAQLMESAGKYTHRRIEATPIRDSYPLSNAQQRLWTLCQFKGASGAFNIPVILTMKGVLNESAFRQSVHMLLNRHEILRTAFRMNNEGEVRQYILDPGSDTFEIECADLRDYTDNQAAAVKKRVETERFTSFDLNKAPLIRMALLRTADEVYICSIVLHHIISDRWSMNVLVRELIFLYNQLNRHELAELAPLRIQYRDYASWQQKMLADKELNYHREYWLKQLSGKLPVLNFTDARERPAIISYAGAQCKMTIAEEKLSAFTSLLRIHQATLFTGLTAVAGILCHQFSGQKEFILGAPFAGRNHNDLENQVGFYVNMLPLRIDLDENDSFTTLLLHTRETVLNANEHQDYPLDLLMEDLSVLRETSRGAIFDVVVSLLENQLDSSGSQQFDGLEISYYEELELRNSRFDLLFNFEVADGKLFMDINYNTDLFSPSLIQQMLIRFEELLTFICLYPDLPVSGLIFLNPVQESSTIGFNAYTIPDHGDLSDFNF